MNLKRAEDVLAYCLSQDVREFIVCAGARNAPLIELLTHLIQESSDRFRSWSFFEERSGAFFALGRIEQSQRPVAILTTSGTAVAELLPACIEARYQGRPLLLVSADRPSRFRGSGSPQAIDQVKIFGSNVEAFLDLEDDFSALKNLRWSRMAPLHLNVCLEEPQSHRATPEELKNAARRCQSVKVSEGSGPTPLPHLSLDAKPLLINPLIVVGPVPIEHRTQVMSLLQNSKSLIYAETLSGMTGVPELQSRLLFSEELATEAIHKNICDGLIRIGSVPTLRLWRDLEEKLPHLPVLNIVPPQSLWSGLARQTQVWSLPLGDSSAALSSLFESLPPTEKQLGLIRKSESARIHFATLTQKFPRAEMSLVEALGSCAQAFRLYLGNSLPVREMDWVAPGKAYQDVYANRGANGIDGQVSTSLGWSEGAAAPLLTVVGDLTAMYDLAALAVTAQLDQGVRQVVVINNGGGMIFKKIFQNPNFLNTHQTSFENWAQMFGWSYRRIESAKDFPSALVCPGENMITELLPDASQSDAFQKEWSAWIQA